MGFLFKSLFFFGVVCLVILRDAERQPAPREPAVAARVPAAVSTDAPARPRASAKSEPSKSEPSPVAFARDALADLAEEASAKIATVARDHCIAHPMDCLQAAERIGRATAAVEPPRRPAGLGAAP
ncbi:hypothetical protein MSC49_09020 [Methylosinus sp. C49]|uniref:hypothetical protein n=1 Tax=Methylosinus sp. C49 TaxID=2699395 RepID=UPI001366D3D9|nr:hypothetical protein [Methylosinus sp. C49]BBU60967.1 hypothetical protein MSC49_09020 [Methylosinus sp. C49]